MKYVQPLSGTAPSTTISAAKHSEAGSEQNANTIPAVCFPFAMTQWTPETKTTETKCIPPYDYRDRLLTGFRGTHWISGSCMQDYGSVTIVPVVGKLKTKASECAIPFSHKDEAATPASYKVDLPAAHLTAELSATARCGLVQFTMQQDDSLYVLVIPNSDRGEGFVQINAAKGEVWGYNPAHRIYQGWGEPAGFNGCFFMKIEKTIESRGVFSSEGIFQNDSMGNAKSLGAFLGFKLKKGERLLIRIGTSFTSIEGAQRNLQKENAFASFDETVSKAKAVWEKALSQIKVETGNEREKRIFYTALYHSFLHPRLFNDVDGRYPRFAGKHQFETKKKGNYYDDFSMWDIYRAQLPLLEILQPGLVNDFVQSMILKGQQGGWLPIFPCWNNYTAAMIGDHVTAFIASAYNKGIRDYDVNEGYRLMRQTAFDLPSASDYKNGKGRRALTSYLHYGYIPMEDSVPEAFHKKEQVSRTLEYAYDDYALSVVAKALNKTGDYQKLKQRSLNYKNVFDKSVNAVRGRHADGSWASSFHPDVRESYITEGTPRQYTFYVPQDVPGLAALMGGQKALEKALDSLFEKGEYWHGNEPGHQIPFLYNYTTSPWKTQRTVQKILSEEYGDGPGGLSGNDDAGQMSAWYVFASLGFYPVDPVSNFYALCTPIFDNVVLRLENRKNFRIVCHRKKPNAIFIQKITLNGKSYNTKFLSYSDVVKGGLLEIYLSDTPTKSD
ncbi:GH92 family glycosyl hydrolase [Flavisolibacter ginsenosidimutans]